MIPVRILKVNSIEPTYLLTLLNALIICTSFFSVQPLELDFQGNLWYLKTRIVEDGRFGDDFRLFRENEMEIEEDDYLPLSQVFEDVENNQVIKIYILTPTAAEISVNNQMVDCKLLVGKGPKMKILQLETGSKDVTLEPIGWVSNKNGILLPKLF